MTARAHGQDFVKDVASGEGHGAVVVAATPSGSTAVEWNGNRVAPEKSVALVRWGV